MNGPTAIDISPLQNQAEAEQAGQWLYQEWARFESAAVWAENQASIAQSLDPAVTIPKFFGCRVDGELVGMSSVVPDDLPTRPGLGPWLANVLVVPEWRKCGLGRALTRHVMDYIGTLQVPMLYLYTFDQIDLYQHLGWTILEQDQYVGRAITIMQYSSASTVTSAPAVG